MQLAFFVFAEKNDSLKVGEYYTAAFNEISNMLNNPASLNFEDAIFAIENAHHNYELSKEDYNNALNFHATRVLQLAEANTNKIDALIAENNNPSGIEIKPASERKKLADNLLLNWAIYTYLTDTTYWKQNEDYVAHYPIQYETSDPFGNNNWESTMVSNILYNSGAKGNCFSLAALYYIFSQRLQTEAFLSTAPNHIFIQHKGMDETYYNVELTSHSFPGSGTIKTYTYTSHKAISKGLAMKRLTEKEAVALCAVYLAKGFERKSLSFGRGVWGEGFKVNCAELALQFDSLCLSALLLKQQILAENKNNSDELLANMQKLQENGYEQMPTEMNAAILAEIQHKKEASKIYATSPFEELNNNRNYFSLSKNKYPEMKTSDNNFYTVGNICLNNAAQEIHYMPENNLAVSEIYDPVVFALSIDPLAEKYPTLSPYNFCANNPIIFVDPDGKEIKVVGSRTYQEQYALARERILDAGGDAARIFTDLENSSTVYTVKENNNLSAQYDPQTNTIDWDPTLALAIVDDNNVPTGGNLSPVAVLAHEMSHAWDEGNDIKTFDAWHYDDMDIYYSFDWPTEFRAVMGAEADIQLRYGGGRRLNHKGNGYRSSSVISTETGTESGEDKFARAKAFWKWKYGIEVPSPEELFGETEKPQTKPEPNVQLGQFNGFEDNNPNKAVDEERQRRKQKAGNLDDYE